ncbi:MAG: hypothetical protein ACRD88_14420, partial [Terriglobia bacterium]
ECTERASVAVVTIPWEGFRQLDASYFQSEDAVVIDCWRILHPAGPGNGLRYVALGKFDSGRTVAAAAFPGRSR